MKIWKKRLKKTLSQMLHKCTLATNTFCTKTMKFWYKKFRTVFSASFLLFGTIIKVDICYVNNVKNKL